MARTFSSGNNLIYPSNYNGTAPVTAVPATMACWCRFSGTATQNVLYVSNGEVEYFGISISMPTVGRIAANTGQQGDATAETTTGITINTWHHCCAVFASTTSRIAYIDGGSSGSNSTSKSPISMVNLALGCMRNFGGTQFGPMDGQMAEVGIWNVALSDAEVASLARGVSPYNVRPDALAAYWPLYGLESPEPDWKPGIQVATRYPMTLVGTPPQYAGHPPIVFAKRAATLLETGVAGGVISGVFGSSGIFGGRIVQ